MAIPCACSQMSSAKVKMFCERMMFISLQMKVAEGVDPGPRVNSLMQLGRLLYLPCEGCWCTRR